MKFGKLTLLFSILAFLTLAGFGCKGLSQTQVQATAPVTLEYWTVFDDVDALQKEIAAYRATRPYITINLRQLRADELYPRLVEALAEDRGPDIISVQNRRLGEFISKLAPMPASVNDTLVTVEKTTLGTNTLINTQVRPMVSLSQLDSQYVKAVRDDVVRGGQIFGLPLSMDMMAVFYNKDLLDRSGIPEAPKNWEEFQAAAKKVTKYDKKTGKIIQSGAALGTGDNVPGSDDLLYLLFRQSNVGFVARDGQAVFNMSGQAASQVMDFYTDFANPTRDTYAWSSDQGDALEGFLNGKVGFFFGYSYNLPTIRARASAFDFRIMPLFQLNPDEPVNVASYWMQSVVAKSKHPNEAWGLIDFLTHSKTTKDYLDQTGRPTALRAYIVDQKSKPDLEPFVDQILIAENWYRGRDYAGATKAVQDMLAQWLQPAPDPDKVGEWRQNILNQAAEKINQTL
ncbi:MAG: extracellular solute-binding protein [Candidatus Magasanikbacteria bacterium]